MFTLEILSWRLADHVKEFYWSACRTCSTIIFPHLSNHIIPFWRCLCRCRRPCFNSLMTTATTRKRSLENKNLPSRDYSTITPSCLHSTMWWKYTTTRLVCAPLNYIRRIKDLLLLCSSCQNRKCGNFTLLFCRGQHGIVLKCVPHVQHAYFSFLPARVWLESWLVNYVVSISFDCANLQLISNISRFAENRW